MDKKGDYILRTWRNFQKSLKYQTSYLLNAEYDIVFSFLNDDTKSKEKM